MISSVSHRWYIYFWCPCVSTLCGSTVSWPGRRGATWCGSVIWSGRTHSCCLAVALEQGPVSGCPDTQQQHRCLPTNRNVRKRKKNTCKLNLTSWLEVQPHQQRQHVTLPGWFNGVFLLHLSWFTLKLTSLVTSHGVNEGQVFVKSRILNLYSIHKILPIILIDSIWNVLIWHVIRAHFKRLSDCSVKC